MKRTSIAGVLAAACLAPVWAQTSLTVSGVADLAVRQVSNQGTGSVTALVSGSNSTSRLSFRGTEDLGGGLSAGFHLEGGLAVDTGASLVAGQYFDRRSVVSLASNTLGELTLGREYTPTFITWVRYDPFGYVGVAGSGNFVPSPNGPARAAFGAGSATTVRANNAVAWQSPAAWGGFEAGALVALGEGGTAANGQDKQSALRVGYTGEAFSVGAAYSGTTNDVTLGDKFTDAVVGGSYDIAGARLSSAWRKYKFQTSSQTTVLVGASIPAGAVGQLKLTWIKASYDGRVGATSVAANGATQLGAGYVYNLSKRTALYATVGRLSNRGALTFSYAGAPVAGGTSTGYELGLRHAF